MALTYWTYLFLSPEFSPYGVMPVESESIAYGPACRQLLLDILSNKVNQ